jgi:hypothetical protein
MLPFTGRQIMLLVNLVLGYSALYVALASLAGDWSKVIETIFGCAFLIGVVLYAKKNTPLFDIDNDDDGTR